MADVVNLVNNSIVDMEKDVFEPPQELRNEAHIKSLEQYEQLYKKSVEHPKEFWNDVAKQFYWKTFAPETFLEYNFDVRNGPIYVRWMKGATTNLCYNAIDRHVENGLSEKIAFYWEGNNPEDHGKITYSKLLEEVCKCANVLKSFGIKKGDRVAIYMPMIIELCISLLACARIGAIHSIVFGGYSSLSIAERVYDGRAKIMLIGDGVWRGTKLLNLKEIVDNAVKLCEDRGHKVQTCIVVRHLSPDDEIIVQDDVSGDDDQEPPAKRPYNKFKINWHSGRDVWWHEVMEKSSPVCEPEWMDAEDPLFMLYTSGSTGKPKGVLHTVGGYMLYSTLTFKYVFDYHSSDVFWCTADVGWITGHTYVCYGPLCNGATGIIFEGVPLYPDAGRFWEIVDKYKVTKFYTAPTAIRTLMKFGDEYVTRHSRESLKVLGTVGEPINPEAWLWYHRVVGNGKCAIVDTFWQTETGGHVLTPLPGATPTKPGSACFPFFGIVPEILSENGEIIPKNSNKEGYLVFKQPWPGIMRTVYGNHERFETTYFKKFPGYYCTGDGARQDKDGYFWITGRIDDMVNVSGHLLSTAEVESALIEHEAVTEAASVSHPHEIKGDCIYCFVTLKEGYQFTDKLLIELKNIVRKKIGPFAQPDFIQNAPALPKTRSGKIMRRILRKVAVGDSELGDISTLADETVVDILFKLRPEKA